MQLGFSSNVAPDMVTLTNLVKGFSFCTEFKSSWQKVRQLPEWSWHVFSQITTDLFSKHKGDDYTLIKKQVKLKCSFDKSWGVQKR